MKKPRRVFRVAVGVVAAVVVAFCGLWIAGPTAVSFGPYVQNVTRDAAEICFYDQVPSHVEVVIDGRADKFDAPNASVHRVAVSGLQPDTRYDYQVRDPATGASRGGGSFKTAPEDAKVAFRFAVLGDSGKVPVWVRMHRFGWDRLRGVMPGTMPYDVAKWVAAQEPDFLVHLGDVIYHTNEVPAYEGAFFIPFAAVLRRAPLVATFGNHDVDPFGKPLFFRLFGASKLGAQPRQAAQPHGDFSHTFVWGGVRFLVLDTFFEQWEAGSAMHQWLVATLRDNLQPRTVVIMHKPGFTDERDAVEDPIIQQRLWPVFARNGVDLVLSGDSHSYQRFHPVDGVTQVIVGTGGKSIRPVDRTGRLAHVEETFGFLLVEATGTRIDASFWAGGADALDRFTIGGK